MLTFKQQKLLLELRKNGKMQKSQFMTYKSVRFFENMGELVEIGIVKRFRATEGVFYDLTMDGKIFVSWLKSFFYKNGGNKT